MKTQRPMSSLRITFGTIAMASALFLWGMWSETASISATAHLTSGWSATAVSADPRADERDLREPTVDIYGNEVHRAVGDYRIDYRGDVYERHSPRTALPKLAPPGA